MIVKDTIHALLEGLDNRSIIGFDADMNRKPTILERAFELSADGSHKNMEHIQHTLRREGYENVGQHFSSMALKRQMRARINAVSKS